MNGWVIIDEEDYPMSYIYEDDLLVRSRTSATIFATEAEAEEIANGYDGVRIVKTESSATGTAHLRVCWECKGVGHSTEECAILKWIN